jgi:hypothetical protein
MSEETIMWLAFAIVIGIPAVLIGVAIANAAWHDRTDFNDGPETWGSQDIDSRVPRL